MFRLSRFFISDIVAGENIIKDGFFPICREGEKADHGVLFAPNGSCKTTLLSFLLSVFCPEKRRFVQYLQSSGDKSIDQYLIPGRPALVLLDLVTTIEPTLFESEPEEHLVIGQLLYQHKNALGRIDRVFFTTKEKGFFESLCREWKGFLEQDYPHAAARDYILPQVLSTSSQREWEEKLESLGLDPWLINRQVDFARSEGGIKDAFKFKAESEFLSFFLGCVTDLNSAVKLRESASQSIEKMRNRPEKKAQLKSIWNLREKISGFDEMGNLWRIARKEGHECRLKLGEGRYLLNQAEKTAAKRLDATDKTLENSLIEKKEAQKRIDLVRVNTIQVKTKDLSRQLTDLEKKIEKNRILILTSRAEQNALNAAGLKEQIRKIRAEISNRDQALCTSDEKILPIRKQTGLRAAQFHHRLQSEKEQWLLEDKAIKEKQRALHEERDLLRAEIFGLKEQQQLVQNEIIYLSTLIQAGVEAAFALELSDGETPLEGEKRIGFELTGIEKKQTDLLEKIENTRLALDEASRKWKVLQSKKASLEASLDKTLTEVRQEKEQRDLLLADRNLVMLASSLEFDPASHELMVRLQESLGRQEDKLSLIQRKDLALEAEIRRLNSMATLAVDDETRKLIDHYLGRGFQPAEIKAFPEYLSALNSDPEFLAAFLEKDPGRFTGIMASSETVIEKIMDESVPEWLVRPVVISVPCPIDQVDSVESHVIIPEDAVVYSQDYINQRKERLGSEKEALEKAISELQKTLRSNKASAGKLSAYQERYKGAEAADALSHKVELLETELETVNLEIIEIEKNRLAIEEEKTELLKDMQDMSVHKATKLQQLQQFKGWMRQYGDLDDKRQKEADAEKNSVELKNKILFSEDKLGKFGEKIDGLLVASTRKEATGKILDKRINNIPVSPDIILDNKQMDEAISINLDSLENLYSDSLNHEKEIANELGVESIRRELEKLRKKYGVTKSELDDYLTKKICDPEKTDYWAACTEDARLDRSAELAAVIEDATEAKGKDSGRLEGLNEKRELSRNELKNYSKRGIISDISEEELASGDPEAMLHSFHLDESRIREEIQFLEKRIPEQTKELDRIKIWERKIALGQAGIRGYEAYWDAESPRLAWGSPAEAEDPIQATDLFLRLVEDLVKSEEKARLDLETHRKKLSRSFERLQNDLRDETLQHRLPSIVDELRRHDTESLGNQSSEMIQKCDNLAKNIESDLARSEQFMNSLIEMMLLHVKECHRKLQASTKILMPDNVFIYGGKPILKSGGRLDFKVHDDIFRQSVENWLYELIEQNRMPEVNAKVGNVLGSELMYRLLRATGKNEFGIRLLKCDDTGKHYEPVGKDLGSGGEALTTAVLLYSLLASMRQKRRNIREDRLPAFLIADNPLGVCNRSDFLDAQLKVAKAMGIQCIYFTGINDTESLGLFEHRIAIRKSGRQLTIDGNSYNMLEVIEQNVEEKLPAASF